MGIRAFIVRPFYEKETRGGVKINFDAVERDLIAPALAKLGIEGGTTGEVVRAGNIREDMFQLLLTADLVVADVSIDNANVFYELGIRQALRDKWTVLLRCKGDNYPFDLSTDRYLEYDHQNPAAKLDDLVRTLNATVNGKAVDSPVFKLLPRLKVQEHRNFLVVPDDFDEAVNRAMENKNSGELELLADEARGFQWESEGERMVGRAQFKLKSWEGARRSWEAIRKVDPDDLEANQKLATIYQRLQMLSESDLAVERALKREGLTWYDRAEIRSLRASNEKTRWREEWEKAPPEQQRAQALRSGYLDQALLEYGAAFEEDLNHYYAGINALAMGVIKAKLIEAAPDVWAERFDTEEEEKRELEALQKRIDRLTSAVEVSLQAARKRKPEVWIETSEAARVFLTSTRPARVAAAYRQALVGAEPFVADTERRQLQLYLRLGILEENVKSALEVLPAAGQTQQFKKQRLLLFAGHMLDKPGRVPQRFPPEKEEVARQAIREAVMKELNAEGAISHGIAGGSHGGDLIFHEVCAELGLKTELWLALPPEKYIPVGVQNYVGPGSDRLVDRFRHLQRQLTCKVMAEEMELPRWLRTREDYDFWQRHTLWMVYNALRVGAENLTLIALWDGDYENGTGDFVRRVQERGGKVVPIPTKQIFQL